MFRPFQRDTGFLRRFDELAIRDRALVHGTPAAVEYPVTVP